MSPEAIQSLIDMFGVEQGVQILNLFTAPNQASNLMEKQQSQSVKERPKELYQDTNLMPDITTG